MVLVIYTKRENVFVELSPLAGYVVAGAQGINARFKSIVDEVSTTVRQMTVGIRIPDAPVKGIASEGVLAGKLTVICSSTAVVILCASLQVRLGAHAITPGISAGSQLVEDVFELILVIAVLGKEGEVEHCSESHVIIILVVNRVTKIVRFVICRIIDAIEVVLHVLVGAVFVGIVQSSEHAECSSAEHPALVQAGRQFQVAQRLLVLDEPIIIESVAQERSSIIAHRFSVGIELWIQVSMDASIQASQSIVETQEICSGTFRVRKILKGRRCIPVSAHGDVETVFCRNLLGVDDDETARVVCGIFSRWRLHDGKVVNLRTWDDIE